MLDNCRLPRNLHRLVDRELEPDETIRWIEQPIPRFFTRSTVGICLVLLVPVLFFSYVAFEFTQQLQQAGQSVFDWPGKIAVVIYLMGISIPLILIIFLPIAQWLEVRQTVYVITNQRAIILIAGWTNTIYAFIPAQVKVVLRREHPDGSGDLIVFTHQSKDYDGDIQTQEIGFKQLRNPKAFEKKLQSQT